MVFDLYISEQSRNQNNNHGTWASYSNPRLLNKIGIWKTQGCHLVHLKFSEPRIVEYNEVFFLLICDVHEF